jgi:hypothetical protein
VASVSGSSDWPTSVSLAKRKSLKHRQSSNRAHFEGKTLKTVIIKRTSIVGAQPLPAEICLPRVLTKPRSLLPHIALRLRTCKVSHPMIDLPHRLYFASNRCLIANVCDPLEQTTDHSTSFLLCVEQAGWTTQPCVTKAKRYICCWVDALARYIKDEHQRRLSTNFTRICPWSWTKMSSYSDPPFVFENQTSSLLLCLPVLIKASLFFYTSTEYPFLASILISKIVAQ